MNCKKVQSVLLEYLEGELADREQDEILTHLNQCQQCHNELKAWENLRHELQADTLPSPTPGYWEGLASRTLSELTEKPQPLFRPAWGVGLVLAGILILIVNLYWFSGKPVKKMVQTRGDEVRNETIDVEHIAFIRLTELNTTELEELVDELTADYEETKVEVLNNSGYPQNAYYESIMELNNEEIEMLLEDQIFIQPLTGDDYHELL